MESIRPDHPLRLLFCGLVEHAFCTRIGVCDPNLTGYLADLLVEFTHVERYHRVRNAQGKELEQIVSMLAVQDDDSSVSEIERDRAIYRKIGDYTLFWAGVYPEQLKRSNPRGADVLLDYVSQGKKCYAIVSELAGEGDDPPSSMFRHLSEDFESCLYGLGLVRRDWEHRPDATGGELLY